MADEDKKRAQIQQVMADSSIKDKGKAISRIMLGKWVEELDSVVAPRTWDDLAITDEDKKRTWYDESLQWLGCKHYRRGCKIRAACCGRIYTCRVCHNEAEKHKIDRRAITTMLCMHCNTLQPINQYCSNPDCVPVVPKDSADDDDGFVDALETLEGARTMMSRWYCDICKFHDDTPGKAIFHCQYCGLCRLGNQSDFFHCMTCDVCLPASLKDNHKCTENKMKSGCPICAEPLYESREGVQILEACGHCIHSSCLKAYIQQGNYRCPVCMKSYVDLSSFYAALELELAEFDTPVEYQDTKAKIMCNDCNDKSEVPFSLFFVHKCMACGSFNTRILETSGMPTPEELRVNPHELQQRLDEAATVASQNASAAMRSDDNEEEGETS